MTEQHLWRVALGDQQYPLTDAEWRTVEAASPEEAREKAKAAVTWGFVLACVEVPRQ